jgi:cytidylate kinase
MMNAALDRCVSFISSQTPPAAKSASDSGVRRAITISRQAGCGAVQVAAALAHYLEKNLPRPGVPWTVFDRNLMEKVLEDHNLPKNLANILAEDRVSELEDMLAETFHMRPHTRTIVQQTAETMLQLADCGNVILIGRAGNVITAKLPHVLHVRLVAPLAARIARICSADKKSPAAAKRFCLEEEAARARYLKRISKPTSTIHCNITSPSTPVASVASRARGSSATPGCDWRSELRLVVARRRLNCARAAIEQKQNQPPWACRRFSGRVAFVADSCGIGLAVVAFETSKKNLFSQARSRRKNNFAAKPPAARCFVAAADQTS